MSEVQKKELLSKVIDPDSVRIDRADPRYTIPPTYGVYELKGVGQPFHYGNHPIRGKELQREYPDAEILSTRLFRDRRDAKEFAAVSNKKG